MSRMMHGIVPLSLRCIDISLYAFVWCVVCVCVSLCVCVWGPLASEISSLMR